MYEKCYFLPQKMTCFRFFKENHRSRLDSAASDISQYSVGHNSNTSMTYVSPPRQYRPPSDVESEHGGDESDYESNTVSCN